MIKVKKIFFVIVIILSFSLFSYNVNALVIDEREENYDFNDNDTNNLLEDTNKVNSVVEAEKIVDDILNDKELIDTNDVNDDDSVDINDVTEAIYKNNDELLEDDNISDDLFVSVENNKKEVYINDEISIDFYVKGFIKDKINGLEGNFEYSTNKLELLDIISDSNDVIYGGFNDNGKFVYILNNYNKEDVLLTFKFKAIGLYDARVKYNNLMLSYNGMNFLDTKESDMEIVFFIKDNNESLLKPINYNPINKSLSSSVEYKRLSYDINNIKPGKKVRVSYVKLSNDNTIKSLVIKDYKINFDKDILEYSITVGNKVNKLELTVILNDKNADYEIIGNNNFKVGNNKVYIVVTAEDGSVRNYVINVKKEKPSKEYYSNSSRNVIIALLIMIILGLIYIIFKDDDDEREEN